MTTRIFPPTDNKKALCGYCEEEYYVYFLMRLFLVSGVDVLLCYKCAYAYFSSISDVDARKKFYDLCLKNKERNYFNK